VTQFTVRRGWVLCGLLLLAGGAAASDDASVQPPRQALADAWWTGPLLAPNASTFPAGHWLVEPYVFDVITNGHFDTNGTRQPGPREHDLGSLTYIIYGLTDRLAVGLLPRFGYNEPAGQPNSSSVGLGDLGVQLQYGLTSFHEGSWIPATAVVLGETLPTGRYDRLAEPSDGSGAGVYTTALSWYSQQYLWLPNGRILRARLDLTYAVSGSAGVADQSVYGTAAGFRGRVYPGDAFTADAAAEYSVTRNWVIATDLVWVHNSSTRLTGSGPPVAGIAPPVDTQSGSSEYLALAPAVEYSWSSRAGIIVGARIFIAGRNISSSITPAAAINLAF
jgi:Putative MetA-pathway of phenol degradation